MEEEELWESMERYFQAYGKPLEKFTSSKYLGRVITAGGDDWPVLVVNLVKAWKIWARMTRILGRDGADRRISGMFFNPVVQAVFIFGSET